MSLFALGSSHWGNNSGVCIWEIKHLSELLYGGLHYSQIDPLQPALLWFVKMLHKSAYVSNIFITAVKHMEASSGG